eukprot:7381351-Prymnesium_polylepis.1
MSSVPTTSMASVPTPNMASAPSPNMAAGAAQVAADRRGDCADGRAGGDRFPRRRRLSHRAPSELNLGIIRAH